VEASETQQRRPTRLRVAAGLSSRTIARHERGRIHGGQAAGPRMTDDDCFNHIDSVDADYLGPCEHAKLTRVRSGRPLEASPQASCLPPLAGTQDDENTPPASEHFDRRRRRRRAGGLVIATDDEIHGPDHLGDLAAAGAPTTTGPVSVRKNASSCRSSIGFSFSGRSSLWPVMAAGARL